MQAHTDELEWLAKEGFTVTSSNDEIHVLAKQKITLKGGQTSIELDGMNITLKMPGLLDVKGTSKSFVGPKGRPAELPVLPVGLSEFKQGIELNYQYGDIEPVEGAPYKVIFSDGSTRTGKLDKQGFARIEGTPNLPYHVELGEDQRSWQPPPLEPFDAHKELDDEVKRQLDAARQKLDPSAGSEGAPR